MNRRIGPAPIHEQLEIYWKPLLLAFAGASLLTPFILWVKFGWPPQISLAGCVRVWCGMFALMMIATTQHFWQAQLWLKLAILVALSAALIALVSFLAIPIAASIGLIPPILPITPVNP